MTERAGGVRGGGDGRRDLARGGLVSFAGAAFSAVAGFAFTIVLTRSLGDSGAGLVMQAVGVFSIAMAVGKLGLDSTAIWILPRLRASAPAEVAGALRFMAGLAFAGSVAAGAVVWVLAPVVWGSAGDGLDGVVRAMAAFVPFGSLSVIGASALRALGSVRAYVATYNVAIPALRPPLVAVAALATGSAAVVGATWAVPFVVVGGVIAAMVARAARGLGRVPGAVRIDEGASGVGGARAASAGSAGQGSLRRRIVGFAMPRTVSSALEQAVAWLDVVLVGALAGAAMAGVYGGASRFIQAGLLVDAALRVVVSPRFSRLLHGGDLEGVQRLYSTATVWLVLFASPVYLLMAVFAPLVLSVLGPGFAEGAPVLVVLGVGAIVTFMAGNVHSLLLMSGRASWAAFNKAVVVALNVAGNVVLVPRIGIVGAALTWSASMLLDAVLASIEVRLMVGVRPVPGRAALGLGVAAVTVGVPAVVAEALWGQTWGALAAACGAAAVLFVLACTALRGPLEFRGLGRESAESR